MVKLFIPKERRAGETRVAATPESVKHFVEDGLEVIVEAGAGLRSSFSDLDYSGAGAAIATDRTDTLGRADLVLVVNPPEASEVAALRTDAVVIGFLAPYDNLEAARSLAEGNVTSLAMELVPRISRAQSMDALSSQASIAGYKAVLLAATRLGKYFPLMMTAAGTIKPARVVVMGAGVAGLQAIATAKRLGAIVEVSDIRPVVKEQVESLGGKFIELPLEESGEGKGGYAKEMTPEFLAKQREIVKKRLTVADVAITTALIPGRPAPKLIGKDMVEGMPAGSVIVDLAVAQGGNCELSKADEEVVHNDVLILGPSNLPASSMPRDSSVLFARNLRALVKLLVKEGKLEIDMEDEVVAGSLLTHQGKVINERTASLLEGSSS
ncbi:MAG: Re/Si-specific NAD(P)(+) transhydrogenase subunit alpha [Deltaproteobacteria bacterium]|nr:Re/Si-specific NAD(P)(+) transhydrogenase subunit alpha [Deltaproteobacteria bacterium]